MPRDKRMPKAHASYITSAEDLMLNLQLKQNVSVAEKATFDWTRFWRDASFHRGGFQLIPHYESEAGAKQ